MRIVVKRGEQVISDLVFEDEEIFIGSDPNCAVCLPDMRIKPRSARIWLDKGQWHLERLSGDELLVNRNPIGTRHTFTPGEILSTQEYSFEIHLGDDLNVQAIEEQRLNADELAKIKDYPLPQGSTLKKHFEPLSLHKGEVFNIARLSINLCECRDFHELVDESLNLMLRYFHGHFAWIGIRRMTSGELEVISGRLTSGQNADSNTLIDLLQYRCLERGQHICIRKVRDHKGIGSAMAIPLANPSGQFGMIYIDREPRANRFQVPDMDQFSVISCQIMAKLEAILQQRQQRTTQLSQAEIGVVHEIQEQLDPKVSVDLKNHRLAAYSRSGQEHPGDVYDIMEHPDTGMAAIMVGHVNATGASLALSMARLHSTFRIGCLHTDPPHALARSLNWLMYDEKDSSTVDAFFLMLDPPSGKFRYTRAGRIGGFIVNAQGEPRLVAGADGPSIGRIRNHEYISKIEQLVPGEMLVIYTRGVATSSNSEGERFGEKKFIELVCDGFGQMPAVTIQDISYELSTFTSNGRQPDDISLVLLHRME